MVSTAVQKEKIIPLLTKYLLQRSHFPVPRVCLQQGFTVIAISLGTFAALRSMFVRHRARRAAFMGRSAKVSAKLPGVHRRAFIDARRSPNRGPLVGPGFLNSFRSECAHPQQKNQSGSRALPAYPSFLSSRGYELVHFLRAIPFLLRRARPHLASVCVKRNYANSSAFQKLLRQHLPQVLSSVILLRLAAPSSWESLFLCMGHRRLCRITSCFYCRCSR